MNLDMHLCGQSYRMRLPSTDVRMYILSLSNRGRAFPLYLKTPRMLKAEQSSLLLPVVLLQEKNYAEKSFLSHILELILIRFSILDSKEIQWSFARFLL